MDRCRCGHDRAAHFRNQGKVRLPCHKYERPARSTGWAMPIPCKCRDWHPVEVNPVKKPVYQHQHPQTNDHPVVRTRKVDDMYRVCRDCGENVVPIDNRDPIDRYGTPEHEAWLIEMERQEG